MKLVYCNFSTTLTKLFVLGVCIMSVTVVGATEGGPPSSTGTTTTTTSTSPQGEQPAPEAQGVEKSAAPPPKIKKRRINDKKLFKLLVDETDIASVCKAIRNGNYYFTDIEDLTPYRRHLIYRSQDPECQFDFRLWSWMMTHFDDHVVSWKGGGLKYPMMDAILWYTSSDHFIEGKGYDKSTTSESELIPAMKHYAIIVTSLYNALLQGKTEFDPSFLKVVVKNVATFLGQEQLPHGIREYFKLPWIEANLWKSNAERMKLVMPKLTTNTASYEYWGQAQDDGVLRGGSYLSCLLEVNTMLAYNTHPHNPATDYALMLKVQPVLRCFTSKRAPRASYHGLSRMIKWCALNKAPITAFAILAHAIKTDVHSRESLQDPILPLVLQTLKESEEHLPLYQSSRFIFSRLLREVTGDRSAQLLPYMDAEGEDFNPEKYDEISDFGHLNYLFNVIARPLFTNSWLRFRHPGGSIDHGGVLTTWATNNWGYLSKPALGIFASADIAPDNPKKLPNTGLVLNTFVDPEQARAIARIWGTMEIVQTRNDDVNAIGIVQSPYFGTDFIDMFISGPINRFDRGHEQKLVRKYVLKHTQDLREQRAMVHFYFLDKKWRPLVDHATALRKEIDEAGKRKTEMGETAPIPVELLQRQESLKKQIDYLEKHRAYWVSKFRYNDKTFEGEIYGLLIKFASYVQPDDMDAFFLARRWHPNVSTMVEFLRSEDEHYFDSDELNESQKDDLWRALPFYYDQVLNALVNRVLEVRKAFRETLNAFYDVRSSTRGTAFALAYHHRIASMKKLTMYDIMKHMKFVGCDEVFDAFVEDYQDGTGTQKRRNLTGEEFMRKIFTRLANLDKRKKGKSWKDTVPGVYSEIPENMTLAEVLGQFVCADSSKPPEGVPLTFKIECVDFSEPEKDFRAHTCSHALDVNTDYKEKGGVEKGPRVITVKEGVIRFINHMAADMFSLTLA